MQPVCTRRQFVEGAAALGAGVVAGPVLVTGAVAEAATPKMRVTIRDAHRAVTTGGEGFPEGPLAARNYPVLLPKVADDDVLPITPYPNPELPFVAPARRSAGGFDASFDAVGPAVRRHLLRGFSGGRQSG